LKPSNGLITVSEQISEEKSDNRGFCYLVEQELMMGIFLMKLLACY